MQMFQAFLKTIPKNRSEMVAELELPEVALAPYWEPEEFTMSRSDSALTGSSEPEGTVDTDSSIPLSRAMTDSEIDYGRARRYKSRSITDPWDQLKAVLDSFPSGYLDSLKSFELESASIEEPKCVVRQTIRKHSDELCLKMKRFFAEECTVFGPGDPGLEALEEALIDVDFKKIIEDERLEKINTHN